MTATSDSFWQKQIVLEVGDPNGTVATAVAMAWTQFATRGAIDYRLQYLYTKRAAIDQRLAEEVPNFDFRTGKEQFDRSQVTANLQAMRAEAQTEILRIEAVARSTRVPQTGAITTTAPQSPPDMDVADANADRYRGSPYDRTINW